MVLLVLKCWYWTEEGMVDFWYKYILVPEQAARTFPNGTLLICVYSEQHKMRSQLAAQFMPFFTAHSAYFYILRQKVPYFNVSRQKIPYLNVLRQNRVVSNCFATKQC